MDNATTMITYIYHKDSTLWAFEGPEEPKKYQKGDSLTYNEAAWMVYKERMSTDRESALPVVNAPKSSIVYESGQMSIYFAGGSEVHLNPGEPVALPGWGLKINEPTNEDTRIAYRLVRSDPEKKPLTVTFYSGKLWHSDKPVPIKICNGEIDWISPIHDDDGVYWGTCKACRTYDGYSKQTRCTVDLSRGVDIWDEMMEDWLSTAYEVVNPEVIPPIYHNPIDDSLKDGDQITLPEGYGIELRYQDKPDKIMVTFITVPEKPDNSAHGDKLKEHIEDTLYSTGRFRPEEASDLTQEILKGVEPSESQEEMWAEFEKEFVQKSIIRMGTKQIIAELSQKFTITRK